jgi:hypothetical protein
MSLGSWWLLLSNVGMLVVWFCEPLSFFCLIEIGMSEKRESKGSGVSPSHVVWHDSSWFIYLA